MSQPLNIIITIMRFTSMGCWPVEGNAPSSG